MLRRWTVLLVSLPAIALAVWLGRGVVADVARTQEAVPVDVEATPPEGESGDAAARPPASVMAEPASPSSDEPTLAASSSVAAAEPPTPSAASQGSDAAWRRLSRQSRARIARVERFIRRAGLPDRKEKAMLDALGRESAKLAIMRDILRAGGDPAEVFPAMRSAQREMDGVAQSLLPARRLAQYRAIRKKDRQAEQWSLSKLTSARVHDVGP